MVVHYGAGSAGFAVSSATIGGISATIHVDNVAGTTNFRACAIISAIVPTGTTASIVINFSGGSVGRCGIGAWSCTGLLNSAPHATQVSDAQGMSMTLARPRNGIVVAGWSAMVTAAANVTWTNATERYDANSETTTQESGADVSGHANSGNITVSATTTNGNGTVAAAASLTWV